MDIAIGDCRYYLCSYVGEGGKQLINQFEKDNKKQKINIETNANSRPILVFWFDAPPRAGAGAFKFVTEKWGNKVLYICANKLREERKVGGWKYSSHGKADIIYLSELEDAGSYINKFIRQNPEAIHVFNGFRSKTTQYLDKYFYSLDNANIAVWSERPGAYGNKIEIITKTIIQPLVHRYYYWKYSKKIKILLPLGKLGITTFKKYGWKENKMYAFMYDPPVLKNLLQSKKTKSSNPIKILYVGRFARSTKGIDVLINAVNKLETNDWSLDLVGGYGEYKDFTINWANKHPNIRFLGTWPSDKVAERMTRYDLIVVPSRFDGWNVVVNEALHAGVGVIVSTAAVSHELVESSGAGIVVKSGDVFDLHRAIQSAINHPNTLNIWKDRAVAYSKRITSESVGSYLIDILDYEFLDCSKDKPSCPWL